MKQIVMLMLIMSLGIIGCSLTNEAKQNSCAEVFCSNHGICQLQGDEPICLCDKGYYSTGSDCVDESENSDTININNREYKLIPLFDRMREYGFTKLSISDAALKNVNIKDSVSHRQFMSPVKDQESVGWCTTFAVIAAMESFHYHGYKVPNDLSEMYFWSKYVEPWTPEAVYTAKNNFLAKEDFWPWRQNFVADIKERAFYKIDHVDELENKSTWADLFKRILSADEKYNIIVRINVQIKNIKNGNVFVKFSQSRNGYVDLKDSEDNDNFEGQGGHAILLIGYYYDQDKKKTYFEFKNSCGVDAGKDGYYYVDEKYVNRFIIGGYLIKSLEIKKTEPELCGIDRYYLSCQPKGLCQENYACENDCTSCLVKDSVNCDNDTNCEVTCDDCAVCDSYCGNRKCGPSQNSNCSVPCGFCADGKVCNESGACYCQDETYMQCKFDSAGRIIANDIYWYDSCNYIQNVAINCDDRAKCDYEEEKVYCKCKLCTPDGKKIGVYENCEYSKFREIDADCLGDCVYKEVNGIAKPYCINCGNGSCDYGETSDNCCQDCGCADGSSCVDNVCVIQSRCGDNRCDDDVESRSNCCQDCGCRSGYICQNNDCVRDSECGDGHCDEDRENHSNCCQDCGCDDGYFCNDNNGCVVEVYCGNGFCDGSDNRTNCCQDCSCDINYVCVKHNDDYSCERKPWCGNGFCDDGESQNGCCRDCPCDDGYLCQNDQCVRHIECGDRYCDIEEQNDGSCCRDCGCQECYSCEDNHCEEICYSEDHKECVDSKVYWYDSCDNKEDFVEDCFDKNCDNGACQNSCSPSIEGRPYWWAPICVKAGDDVTFAIKSHCSLGQRIQFNIYEYDPISSNDWVAYKEKFVSAEDWQENLGLFVTKVIWQAQYQSDLGGGDPEYIIVANFQNSSTKYTSSTLDAYMLHVGENSVHEADYCH